MTRTNSLQSFAPRTRNDGGAGPEPVQETIFQALVRPSEPRIYVHNDCAGYVLFDLAGGYCLACGAAPVRATEYHKPQTAA